MMTGAVIGFLVWAGMTIACSVYPGRFHAPTVLVWLILYVGTGASIGWLVS